MGNVFREIKVSMCDLNLKFNDYLSLSICIN